MGSVTAKWQGDAGLGLDVGSDEAKRLSSIRCYSAVELMGAIVRCKLLNSGATFVFK